MRYLRTIKLLFISGFWAIGLAAFFTLPVLFESKFVSLWTLTSGYFNYLAHFANLKQLFFSINWGYGASEYGPVDGMSFALGYLHWIVPVVVVASALISVKLRKFRVLVLLFAFSLLSSLFLTHSRSTPIWLTIKPLEFLQFPWRFLSLVIFFASFLSGALAKLTQNKLILSSSLTLILLLNGAYFRPRVWYPAMTDAQKLAVGTESWRLQQTASIFDYLPISAPLPPAVPPVGDLVFLSGSGSFTPIAKKSNYQNYQLQVASPSIVQLQTLYFPGWKLLVDNQETDIDPSLDPLLGRPQVNLSPGIHTLEYILTSTPIRSFSNLLSLLSWVILLAVLFRSRYGFPRKILPHQSLFCRI